MCCSSEKGFERHTPACRRSAAKVPDIPRLHNPLVRFFSRSKHEPLAAFALMSVSVALFAFGWLFKLVEIASLPAPGWQVGELPAAFPVLAMALALRNPASARQQQNARFQALVEHADDVAAVVDADGVVLYVNPALTKLLAEQPATWTGREALPLVHPEDVGRLRWILARLVKSPGKSRTFGCRLRHQDGTWRHVEVIATNLLSDSAVAGLVLNVRDVTARKAVEARSVATQQREDHALARIADGFITLDPQWNFTSVNSVIEQMLGLPRELLLGRNAWEVFPPAFETPVHAAAYEAMREGGPSAIEYFYPPLGIWFDVRFYPSHEGMSIFFHDVTQHRRLTEELRASEARYRSLVEQVPAVIYNLAADEQATRLYFSPYLAELTGYTPEEALSLSTKWLA
jgi:PAS domain S-box-containing protein